MVQTIRNDLNVMCFWLFFQILFRICLAISSFIMFSLDPKVKNPFFYQGHKPTEKHSTTITYIITIWIFVLRLWRNITHISKYLVRIVKQSKFKVLFKFLFCFGVFFLCFDGFYFVFFYMYSIFLYMFVVFFFNFNASKQVRPLLLNKEST